MYSDAVVMNAAESIRRQYFAASCSGEPQGAGWKPALHGGVGPERPDAVGGPGGGAGAEEAGGVGVAGGVGENGEHPDGLGEEGIGVGVVVAEPRLEELDVVAIDAQRLVALSRLQQDVREAERLELL